MSLNKSMFLAGVFFIVVMIFGNVFWRMFDSSGDGAFEKIKKETEANLAKKEIALAADPASNVSSALETSTNTVSENEASASVDAQTLSQKNMDSQEAEVEKTAESEVEKIKDDTADWKTYTDEKKRFEFKYSEDAQIVSSGDLIRISQNNNTWKLRRYSNEDKTDLQAWYNNEFSEKDRKNCIFSESTLKIGGYETKYVNPGSGETECAKPGYFSISGDRKNIVRVEIGNETVENVGKILKTFKFLTE